MPKSNTRGRSDRNDWGVMEMARERPVAAAAAAGAAAAGLFLWSKRHQISQQISELSDQIGEWTDTMGSDGGSSSKMDDTAGLTRAQPSKRSGAGSRSASGTHARSATTSRNRGMSETGGGNASLGAQSGGIGTKSTGSPRGRGRAAEAKTV